MVRDEFLLSERAGESAVIITRGSEVQANHARSLGAVLRYGQLVVMSTTELNDAVITIGLPGVRPNPFYDGLRAYNDYVRERADWFKDYMGATHGLEPVDYDVHLLDSEVGEKPSAESRHWMQLLTIATQGTGRMDYMHDRFTKWLYKPFEFEDVRTSLTGEKPEVDFSSPTFSDWLDAFVKSFRQPLQFKYARAETGGRLYGRESVEVMFSQPVIAEFTKETIPPEDTRNALGDTVRLVTEISVREHQLAVPTNVQADLDQIDAEATRQLNDKSDDDTFALLESAENDPHIYHQREAKKAAYHNLLG